MIVHVTLIKLGTHQVKHSAVAPYHCILGENLQKVKQEAQGP